MSERNTNRIVRVKMPQTITINANTVTDVVAESLRKTWGHLRHAPKILARKIDTNERTVANLIEGKNAPSSATLCRLIAQDDEIFRAILKLTGRDRSTEEEQIMEEAIKAALAIIEGRKP